MLNRLYFINEEERDGSFCCRETCGKIIFMNINEREVKAAMEKEGSVKSNFLKSVLLLVSRSWWR